HCFAPTEQARAHLLAEGVPDNRITVTGNTGIDALFALCDETGLAAEDDPAWSAGSGTRIILVTAHRRESFGPPLESICRALRRLVQHHPDVLILFPVHPNPRVQHAVRRHLADCARVRLLHPLPYPSFVHLLRRATLVLTDSGGVQEEAPAFGTPVLVLRDVTERPEGVAAGVALLVGTEEERILAEASRLLDDPVVHAAMARRINPYGDGKAAGRILEVLRSGAGAWARQP
ncbi:MAG TPA: UDP-N-acetylglucosamine 2-epimerase (non-hydrolyzing), partial [Candidatus Sulfotelmatobacter sp.]|nr:UDP-N-acetylglucosamine 2-epimerase (non-hydrolyzing) [Candidatus Sulfotelmatobacter sp.]